MGQLWWPMWHHLHTWLLTMRMDCSWCTMQWPYQGTMLCDSHSKGRTPLFHSNAQTRYTYYALISSIQTLCYMHSRSKHMYCAKCALQAKYYMHCTSYMYALHCTALLGYTCTTTWTVLHWNTESSPVCSAVLWNRCDHQSLKITVFHSSCFLLQLAILRRAKLV